jgi:hypothetical protein
MGWRVARSLLLAALLAGPLSADVVILASGRAVLGEVIEDDGHAVILRTREGDLIRALRANILEQTRHATAGAYYRDRLAELRYDDVRGHRDLASFCQQMERWDLLAYEVRTLERLQPGDPEVEGLARLLQETGTSPPPVPEEAICVLWLLQGHRVLETYETPDGQLLDSRGVPVETPSPEEVVARHGGFVWRTWAAQQAEELAPWDIAAHLELAQYAHQLGDRSTMRRHVLTVKNIDPRHPLVLRLLGREVRDAEVEAATSDDGFTRSYLRRNRELASDDVAGRQALLVDCLRRGRPGFARTQARLILDIDGDHELACLVAGVTGAARPSAVDEALADATDPSPPEPAGPKDNAVGLVWEESLDLHLGSRPPAVSGRRDPDGDSLRDLQEDPPDLVRQRLVLLLQQHQLQVLAAPERGAVVEVDSRPVRPRYWIVGSCTARESGPPRTFFGATLAYVCRVEGSVTVYDARQEHRPRTWTDLAEGRHHDRRQAVLLASSRLHRQLETFLLGLPLLAGRVASPEETPEDE